MSERMTIEERRTQRLVRLQEQRDRDARVLKPGGYFAGVLMGPPPAIGLCAAGMGMVGRMLPSGPELPQPGCDREICGCSWRVLTKREAEALGLPSFY